MTLKIEQIENIDAAWQDFWPLIDGLQEFHAELLGAVRRPNTEAGSRKRFTKRVDAQSSLRLLVRDESTAVGMGMASLTEDGGWSFQEAVGHLSNFFIQPGSRGSTAVLEMHRQVEAWLRDNGQRQAERGVHTANIRAVKLWNHLGFEPYLEILSRDVSKPRRGPRFGGAEPTIDGISIAKVTDLSRDWPRIWPLLDQLDQERLAIEPCVLPANREQFRRQEIEKAMAGRCLLLLAEHEGEPCALAMGRVLKNPTVYVERVGKISDFFIQKPQRGTALFWRLLDRLEGWLEKKGADFYQTDALVKNQRLNRLWKEIGYESSMITLRKDLGG